MSKTILLVDDDKDDIFFMKRAFEEAALLNPVKILQDGQEAIDYLSGAGKFADRIQYPLPFLVLLDLKMPRVMGLEVLKWLREQPRFKTLIVIVLTSSKMHADIQTAYRLGANSYLVKPASSDKLTAMIAGIKRYWLDLNEAWPESSETSASLGETQGGTVNDEN